MSNISQFSTTAANNNSASPDGFPEGMAPSGLNDSARELMAALAKVSQDQDGSLVTGGTGTAYTLTTNNAHAALVDIGLTVFRINTVNTGSCTLAVDGLTAKTMKVNNANITSGTLKQDMIVAAVYNATNDVFDVWAPVNSDQNLNTTDSPTFASITVTNDLPIASGGTAASTAAAARTNLMIGAVTNSIAGLGLSNGTDADHDIDIAIGSAMDSTNVQIMELTSAFTKQIDATWAAGTGAGGLSSSLTAPANNTWYHVHLVEIAGSAGVLFDTSVTCANGVTDHSVTYYRRIGSVLTNGSANIIAFIQEGDEFTWDVPVRDVNTTNPGTAAVTPRLSTPLGVKVGARIVFELSNSGGATSYALITNPAQTDTSVTATARTMEGLHDATDGNKNSVGLLVYTNTSSQIRYRLSASGAAVTVDIVTLGWKDTRGR